MADEDEGTLPLILVFVDFDKREKADFVDLTLLIVGAAAALEDLTADPLLLIAVPDDFLVEVFDFLVGAALRSVTLEDDAAVFFDGIDEDGLIDEDGFREEDPFVGSFSELAVDSTSSLFSDGTRGDGLRDEAFVDFSSTGPVSSSTLFCLGGRALLGLLPVPVRAVAFDFVATDLGRVLTVVPFEAAAIDLFVVFLVDREVVVV